MAIQDIAAFVGAAAWLYPLSVLLNRWLTKPKIRLNPTDTIEMGYSSLGPIMNLTCAIMTEKRDAIIERIEIEVKHEDGDSHAFIWKTLDELQYEIRSFTGEGGTIGKSQPATALKVNTTMLSEKKIGFQDVKYREQIQIYAHKLAELINHLRKINKSDSSDALFKSKEFTAYNDYFGNGMYWRVGNYTIQLSIFITSSTKPFTESFTFSLENKDIDSLKMNTTFLEQTMREYIPPKEGEQPPPRVIWNWVYPKLEKKKLEKKKKSD